MALDLPGDLHPQLYITGYHGIAAKDPANTMAETIVFLGWEKCRKHSFPDGNRFHLFAYMPKL